MKIYNLATRRVTNYSPTLDAVSSAFPLGGTLGYMQGVFKDDDDLEFLEMPSLIIQEAVALEFTGFTVDDYGNHYVSDTATGRSPIRIDYQYDSNGWVTWFKVGPTGTFATTYFTYGSYNAEAPTYSYRSRTRSAPMTDHVADGGLDISMLGQIFTYWDATGVHDIKIGVLFYRYGTTARRTFYIFDTTGPEVIGYAHSQDPVVTLDYWPYLAIGQAFNLGILAGFAFEDSFDPVFSDWDKADHTRIRTTRVGLESQTPAIYVRVSNWIWCTAEVYNTPEVIMASGVVASDVIASVEQQIIPIIEETTSDYIEGLDIEDDINKAVIAYANDNFVNC